MKSAMIIDFTAYQKHDKHLSQNNNTQPSISDELAYAIQQLIQRLKEANPLK